MSAFSETVGGVDARLGSSTPLPPEAHAYRLAVSLDLVLHHKGTPVLLNEYLDLAERRLAAYWHDLAGRWGSCELCTAKDVAVTETAVTLNGHPDRLWLCRDCGVKAQ